MTGKLLTFCSPGVWASRRPHPHHTLHGSSVWFSPLVGWSSQWSGTCKLYRGVHTHAAWRLFIFFITEQKEVNLQHISLFLSCCFFKDGARVSMRHPSISPWLSWLWHHFSQRLSYRKKRARKHEKEKKKMDSQAETEPHGDKEPVTATETFALSLVVVVLAFSVLVKILRECSIIHSLPALLFFKGEISLRTLIPLFMPGSVQSGSANWDDCGQMFPDKLCVSLFLHRFQNYAWTVA